MPPLKNDAARAQEAIHAIVTRLAVHVPVVIRGYLEGLERLTCSIDTSFRYLSNVLFQAAACTLAVSVITPSRSNSQALYSPE